MINPELLDGSSEEGVNNTIKQTMSSNNNNDKKKDKNKNSKNKTRPIFIVKQRTKLSKYWTPVSHYNETGNFLGAAVFDTKAEAQKYLKIYEQKNITRIQKFVEKKQDNPAARVPVFATREGIKLEVFEESELPPIEKPTFINFKKW